MSFVISGIGGWTRSEGEEAIKLRWREPMAGGMEDVVWARCGTVGNAVHSCSNNHEHQIC